MAWQDLALGTGVARRILAVFLLAALVPLCAFAALSSWMVTSELRRQTLAALRADAKDVALLATQRLQHVEAQLRINARLLASGDAAMRARGRQGLDRQIQALVVLDPQERATPIHGELSLPTLSGGHRAHLAAGGAALVIDAPGRTGTRPTVILIVPVEPSGWRMVARLDERVLWELGEDSTRPAQTELCVFDANRRRLACSEGLQRSGVAAELPPGAVAGTFQMSRPEGRRLAAYWSAPLALQYSVPALTFLLTKPASDAEQPLGWFRRAFTIVVAVTLAAMVWVSLRHIRRTLAPLASLQQGAEGIGRGDFAARVEIASGDEFEALGASFNLMASEVQRQFTELKALQLGTLEALARAIDAKSSWTAGHSQRVTVLGVRIAEEMGLPASSVEEMRAGGLLHDIGKLGVPGRILDKPGALTDEEFAIMKQHPEMGARILAPLTPYAAVIPIVMEHHERFDGSGYPRGLAGEQISLGGRIFAVADVFDAMSSDRPYRRAHTTSEVVAYVAGQSGRMFDPVVVAAFLRLYPDVVNPGASRPSVHDQAHPELPARAG